MNKHGRGVPGPRGVHCPGGAWSWGCVVPGGVPGLGGCLVLGGGTEADSSRQTATVADGTHPTGMHSCCHMLLVTIELIARVTQIIENTKRQ